MNKIQSILGIAVLLVSLTVLTSFQNINDDNKYVYVRVFESLGGMYSSSIIVTDGESILKKIELSVMRPKNLDENVLAI